MKNLLLSGTIALCAGAIHAQNNVGIGTNTPDASAALEVTSTNQGILIPRMALSATNVAAPVSTPATGLMVYNTATAGTVPNDVTPGFYYWDGTQWVRMGSGASAGGSCVTLQEAYDCTTAGAGNTILANSGTVLVNHTSLTNNTDAFTVTTSAGTLATPAAGMYSENNAIGVAMLGYNSVSSDYAAILGQCDNNAGAGTGVSGIYNGTGAGSAMQGQYLGSGAGDGVSGYNLGGTGGNGVFGFQLGNGVSGDGVFGVYGDGNLTINYPFAINPMDAGAKGVNERTNGGTGVYGTGVQGVVGETDYIDGAAVAGWNYGNSSTGSGQTDQVGVLGHGYNGVWGQSDIVQGIGVYGLGTQGHGVVGHTNNTVSYWGMFSEGDIGSTGMIMASTDLASLGTKTFVIDHPEHPDTKLLKHYAIESPEVLNVYRGTAQVDANGEAVIELPSYFEEINMDFSYQLTSVGGAAPQLHVAEEVSQGKFKVAGAVPGKKVSWVVYAERNDLFLRENAYLKDAEPDKTGKFAGKYLYPEGYGQPADKAFFPDVEVEQPKQLVGSRSKDRTDLQPASNTKTSESTKK